VNTDDFEANYLNAKPGRKQERVSPPRYRDVFSPQSNLTLLAYCILALHGVAYDQLLPVFLHLPVDREGINLPFQFRGGFGLDSGRIGVLFMYYGIFCMITQFTVFPYVTQRLGALFCMRACTFAIPFAYFITPYTVLIPNSTMRQVALLSVMALKGLTGVFAFPCITILLTNSAKSLALLGTLNGVATSLAAVARATGPYTAGVTFTWGIKAGYVIAAWWLLGIFAIVGHISTWFLEDTDGFTPEGGSDSGESTDDIMLDTRGAAHQTGSDANTAGDAVMDADSDDDLGIEDEPLLGKEQTI
jgi:hypothetical protein